MATHDESFLQNANFTGGFPSSRDLAPSIIFIVLYAASLPLLIWRLARKQDRTTILIRPSIFLAVRLGMLVLRAVMSKSTYGEGELIAELVLVSVGFLFLIEPTVSLWKRHLASAVVESEYPVWVKRMASFIKVVILAAIGTAIAGSALIDKAVENPSEFSTVKALRQASVILSLVSVALLILALVRTHFTFGLDSRRTLYLLVPALSLLIVAVYRVVQIYSHPGAAVRGLAEFWVLQIVFEFIAYMSLLAISIPTFYPGAPIKDEHDMQDLEAARIKSSQT